jgi:hypothetical protein
VEKRKDANHRVPEYESNLPVVQDEQEISIPKQAEPPEYLQQLMNPTKKDSRIATMSDDEKGAILGVYESHANCREFSTLVNTTIEIYGGIIWDHPDTTSKETKEFKPGWKEILLVSVDEHGEPFTIKASHGYLATHVQSMLALYGWFLWNEPITFKLAVDPKTKGFVMFNQERVKSLLSGMKKKK